MSTVGMYFAATAIRGLNEGIGSDTVVQALTATPADGSLELPVGLTGPTGPTGPAAAPVRWEGDIADPVALAALAERLGPAHAGKTWRVLSTDTVMYWTGTAFEAFTDSIGAPGPTGAANSLTVGTVTTGAAGSDLVAVVTGTAPSQTVNLTVPRGVKGAIGPAGGPGPIRSAADYAESGTPVAGAVPMWDTTTSRWRPTPDPGWRGPWTITEALAWDGGAGFAANVTGTSSATTLAILNIPAQDTAWRPMVFGGASIKATTSGTRADIEVSLGSTSGQIVAVGGGLSEQAWHWNAIVPEFRTSAMTPASSVGVVAAGATASLYAVCRRIIGADTYNYARPWAHLAVWAVPVSGMPS